MGYHDTISCCVKWHNDPWVGKQHQDCHKNDDEVVPDTSAVDPQLSQG